MKTLHQVAAQRLQLYAHGFVFNTLCNHLAFEVMTQFNDGTDNGGIPGTIGHILQEGLIDFKHVDRQAFQIGQGRIPGTEIVNSYRDTQFAQAVENPGAFVQVRHQRTFGYFYLKAAAIKAGFLQRLLNALDQSRRMEGTRRYIHRNRHRTAIGRPVLALFQRSIQHPVSNGRYHTQLLGNRNKLPGQHQPLLGMLPAQQGFRATGQPGTQIDFRLIEKLELFAFQCPVQLAGKLQVLVR